MKKILIFNPKRFQSLPNSFFKNLNEAIFESGGSQFKTFFCNEENYRDIAASNNFDIIFLTRCAGRHFLEPIFKKNKNILKIVHMDDIHYFDEDKRKYLHDSFSFADIILLPYYRHFIQKIEYKKYKNKSYFFPFAAPDSIRLIERSHNNKKILLSGFIGDLYSFRKELYQYSKLNTNLDVLNHPGYTNLSHELIGDNYYNYISKYLASIVTSADSPLNYPIMKYFEIPGCNVIPLFEKISYLNDLGFIENKNYIEINKKNYKNILIPEVLADKNEVSVNARNLILKNHLISNRINLLLKIFNKGDGINWELE